MNSEWKELKIDNLPSDILVEGKYEIADYDSYQGIYVPTTLHPVDCLSNIITSKRDYTYFYRTPEPLPPTHEEIMTLWWKRDKDLWEKVHSYSDSIYSFFQSRSTQGFCGSSDKVAAFKCVNKDYFTNRESAVFPPEAI